MRQYSDSEIGAYIVTGDPLDKAGAYAIQHPEFKPVEHLQGCYANVMGLPLCHLTGMLISLGYPPQNDIAMACQAALHYDCPIYSKILAGDHLIG
jgi:septum formation protein